MKRRATEARVLSGASSPNSSDHDRYQQQQQHHHHHQQQQQQQQQHYVTSEGAVYDASSSSASSAFCFGAQELPTCLTREFKHLTPSRQQQVGIDVLGLQKLPSQGGSSDTSSQASTAAMMTVGDDEMEVPMDAQGEAEEDEDDDITPEMLESLEYHLQQVTLNRPSTSVAYRMALERDQSENEGESIYVRSKFLCAQFLRAVEYETKRAATRLCKHFTVKLELFGPDLLHKPITLDHLSADDMVSLKSGGFQVLPCKDRAGRPILFGRYTCMRYRTIGNMLRALWYIWSAIVEDPKHQKSGIIAIGYENGRTPLERFDHNEEESYGNPDGEEPNSGSSDSDDQFHLRDGSAGFDRALARGILNIPLALPIRPVAYHICADGDRPQWQDVSDMVLVTLCKFVRLRMRFHHGTSMECQYALLTHGVPTHGLPKISPEDGRVDLTNHRRWIEERRRIERESMSM